MNNLVVIFLFVLFMLLRFIISAKGQSANSAQKAARKRGRSLRASKRKGRNHTFPPFDSDYDREGLFSPYAAAADYPQTAHPPSAERLLADENFPPLEAPALGNIPSPAAGSPDLPSRRESLPASEGKAPAPPAAGGGLSQRLNSLSPLKQAVVLKEILDRPRALSDIGEP